jgi:acetyltransferase-like isoleucine patch superfamily enzyme
MLNLLSEIRTKQKVIAHRNQLSKIAVIGEKFCASNAHPYYSVLNFKLQNYSGERERILIGNNCNIAGSFTCNINGHMNIGDYVFINGGGYIRADYLVKIGSHCMIAPRVVIWDTDNHPLSRIKRHIQAEEIPQRKIDSYEAGGGPIIIGDDVWICMEAMILGGVTIGDGAIIAARAVVTKDVPPMTIAAGIPARVIGKVPD